MDHPIPLFTVHMPPDVDKELLKTLHSGFVGQGPRVEEFERLFGEYINNKYVLSLNSGTAALHLALVLSNVGPGDEVITTPMTCFATNSPIIQQGARIVWADIDERTGLIDPLDVERKITSRTKAIMVVDWGGTPCDLDQLKAIAKKYNVKLIEDAAHGVGAVYKGQKVGSIADFTCYSFQAIKHITTVDGGMLSCLNKDDYQRGKLLRWYGIDRDTPRTDFRCEDDIAEAGYKYHMNDVAATIGIVQMRHVNAVVSAHRVNADYYLKNLNKEYYTFTQPTYDVYSSYWLFTMLLPNEQERDQFMAFMKQHNIQVSKVHARNDIHSCVAQYRVNLPGVTAFNSRQVSIPVHWKLTDDDRRRIKEACNEFASMQLYPELTSLGTAK